MQDKIVQIGNELSIYDTVCDRFLLDIIIDKDVANRDKINAIKVWNDLRQRVHTNIKVTLEEEIDFSNVTDDNLESIVEAIMKKNNSINNDESRNTNT